MHTPLSAASARWPPKSSPSEVSTAGWCGAECGPFRMEFREARVSCMRSTGCRLTRCARRPPRHWRAFGVMGDTKRISAIIACYRDEPAIPIMHARLTAVFQKIGVDYEIIFVNDCSPDNAAAVLRELAARDKKVVVINHTRNFGSQSAFSSGMAIASG